MQILDLEAYLLQRNLQWTHIGVVSSIDREIDIVKNVWMLIQKCSRYLSILLLYSKNRTTFGPHQSESVKIYQEE